MAASGGGGGGAAVDAADHMALAAVVRPALEVLDAMYAGVYIDSGGAHSIYGGGKCVDWWIYHPSYTPICPAHCSQASWLSSSSRRDLGAQPARGPPQRSRPSGGVTSTSYSWCSRCVYEDA